MRKISILFYIHLLLTGCSAPTTHLERVQAAGELQVATRWGVDTYHQTSHGMKGLEHDLVELFAHRLGVTVRYVIPNNQEYIIPFANQGRVDFAAANIQITPAKQRWVTFSQAYHKVTPQVVALRGRTPSQSAEHWRNNALHVVPGSGADDVLFVINRTQHRIGRKTDNTANAEQLLHRLSQGEVDYVAAPSHVVQTLRQYYPELSIAFNLITPQPVAWAFAKSEDQSLLYEANRFFTEIKQNGALASLLDRYYGHNQTFDYLAMRHFDRHITERLAKYQHWFEQASIDSGIDWRWLAAIGYQESHWDEKAVSPTGVRGIMMLTQVTAKEMGVKKRTDPEQSIRGGSMYFSKIKRRLDPAVREPDRTWLALAAYNLGYGHVMDARKLAASMGKNPNRWSDIKPVLPLLRDPKWHKQTRYGFARGDESVQFVTHVRQYYDLLQHQTEQAQPALDIANR